MEWSAPYSLHLKRTLGNSTESEDLCKAGGVLYLNYAGGSGSSGSSSESGDNEAWVCAHKYRHMPMLVKVRCARDGPSPCVALAGKST